MSNMDNKKSKVQKGIKWANLHKMECPKCGLRLSRRRTNKMHKQAEHSLSRAGRPIAFWVCPDERYCGFFIKEQKLKGLVAQMKERKKEKARATREFRAARKESGKDKILGRRKVVGSVPLISVVL